MQALAKAHPPKPKVGGYESLTQSLFGDVLNLLPTSETPIALGVAGHMCDQCIEFSHYAKAFGKFVQIYKDKLVYPELHGDVWVMFPCHQHVCTYCEQVTDETLCDICELCSDCCEHTACDSCGHKYEYYQICTDEYHGGHSYCHDCCYFGGEHPSDSDEFDSDADEYCEDCVSPGWKFRGWTYDGDKVDVNKRMNAAGCDSFNPAEAMATFYLLDYVAARSSTNDPLSVTLKREALAQQSTLVVTLDKAFREYLFMAIGGELRHHSHVALGYDSKRNKSAGYWMGLGDKYGRQSLLGDATELFHDRAYHAWPSPSFGGKLWGTAAEILLMRENGRIDAKTFVDRVFSLQHNSGSILDKIGWGQSTYAYYNDAYKDNPTRRRILLNEFVGWDWQTEGCQLIGEAHAAIIPDLRLLMRMADSNAVELFKRAHVARNKAMRSVGQPIEPMPEAYAPSEGRTVRYQYEDKIKARKHADRRAA